MKRDKITNIIVSTILLISGILLVIFPNDTLFWIILSVGIILILAGLIKLKDYYDLQKKMDATPVLMGSILLLILGVIFVIFTANIMNVVLVFGIVLAVFVAISSLFKFIITLSYRTNTKAWLVSMFSSTLFLVLSIVLMVILLNSSGIVLIQLIGSFFIIQSILTLVETLYPSKTIVEIKKSSVIIEADFDEE